MTLQNYCYPKKLDEIPAGKKKGQLNLSNRWIWVKHWAAISLNCWCALHYNTFTDSSFDNLALKQDIVHKAGDMCWQGRSRISWDAELFLGGWNGFFLAGNIEKLLPVLSQSRPPSHMALHSMSIFHWKKQLFVPSALCLPGGADTGAVVGVPPFGNVSLDGGGGRDLWNFQFVITSG